MGVFSPLSSEVRFLGDIYFSHIAQRTDDKTENLFTVPVAMLFYRSVYRIFILNGLNY